MTTPNRADEYARVTGATSRDLDGLPRVDLLERPRLTDVGNAQRFASQHRELVRYVYPWRAWLIWDGTHYARDPGDGVMRLAKATARGLYDEAREAATMEERQKAAKWAMQSESDRGLRAMLTLAQSEPGIPVTPDALNTDPWLLNVLNGTLDLRTATLRPHRREDLITKLVTVAYDPVARCPAWLAFLVRIFDGKAALIEFLQRALGYALTGLTTEQVLPPAEHQAIATLKQGWGDRYAENLRLAQAVVRTYDAKKNGELRDYLERTGAGNDPALIRLAARTGRQWLKQGWRP